jgi:hypothetical protein
VPSALWHTRNVEWEKDISRRSLLFKDLVYTNVGRESKAKLLLPYPTLTTCVAEPGNLRTIAAAGALARFASSQSLTRYPPVALSTAQNLVTI